MKWPLNAGFSIWIVQPMGLKFGVIDPPKVFHFRGDDGIRAYPRGKNHMGVVDYAFPGCAIQIRKGLIKKDPAFKASEAGILLHIEFSAVGHNQRGTLNFYYFCPKNNRVWRGVMLHFFSRFKYISSCTFFLWCANLFFSD